MDKKPESQLTDEAIENILDIVRTAELLAAQMGMTVTDAARTMMKSWQLMQQLKQGKMPDFKSMFTSKRIQ